MGITGLLPFIEKASRKCNIADFSGCTVAIDTYCWLHKGAFACADKLIRGENTDVYVHYCLKYVNMLLSKNIKPILVFDGRHLPAKALTEEKRRETRKLAKKRSAELLQLGKIDEAHSFMRRGVDVTHEMALKLIKACRKRNVDCIVAPYEADAQLAYLNIHKIAQVVITEDSDLILFGCTKVVFKMDLAGNGTLVETCKLPLVMKCPIEKYNFDKFRQMCIMSGCDYLPSLPSIGLAKARQFINTTQDPDISNALRKLPSFFNKSQLVVSDEYRENFLKAEATFKHQLVYDPFRRRMTPLTDPSEEGTDEQYCSNAGEFLNPDIAFQLAIGNVDPFSMKKLDDWHPDCRDDNKVNGIKSNGWNEVSVASHPSIWHPNCSSKILKNSKIEFDKQFIAIEINSARHVTKKIVNMVTPNIDNFQNGLTIEQLSSIYREEPAAKKRRVIVEETQSFSQDILKITTPTKSRNPFAIHSPDNTANKTLSTEKEKSPTFAKCSVLTEDKKEILKTPTKIRNPFTSNTANDAHIYSTEKENSSTNSLSPTKDTSPILRTSGRNFRKYMQSSSYSVLRKLSKFERTTIDSDNPIASRFFGSGSSLKNESQSSGNYSSCVADESDFKEQTEKLPKKLSDILDDDPISSSHDETINNRILTGDHFDWSEPEHSSLINRKISMTSIYSASSLMDDGDNIDKLEELVTPTPSQGLQSICGLGSQSSSPPLSPELWLSKTSHSSVISRTSSVTKKSLCKRPGLQKRSSASNIPSNQQSLITMFGFKKRSPLKH